MSVIVVNVVNIVAMLDQYLKKYNAMLRLKL